MGIPIAAIVGRPNVGKSSLFNWLAGRRIAIVDPTAGVTRDRVSTLVKTDDEAWIELIDTGGMGIQDVDNLTEDVERQIDVALRLAHLVVFVVDARDGLVPLDVLVADKLRGLGKPVLCVANKCDSEQLAEQVGEFFKLGHGAPLPVSVKQNQGKPQLLKQVLKLLPDELPEKDPSDVSLKLAIVGRRNTGKSTFINQLAESERMIVSEVPGTTRDSVDVRFELDGKTIIAIDTAGVRRKRSVKGDVEFYSMARAERSIRRADVVLLFFDAAQKVSMVDKKLAEYVLDQAKPVIFVANKWDLMKPLPTGEFAEYLQKVFPMLDYVPIAFITAKSGKNVQAVLNLAQNLHKQASARVGTGELNRVIQHALEQQNPPLRHNRRPKIYFGTQAAANPPTIVLFTNSPELFSNTYRRYLLKTFRDQLPFAEVPIKLFLRSKQREEGETDKPDEVEEVAVERKPRRQPTPPAPPKKAKKANPPKPAARKDNRELWDDV
ncbi:MAG: ribosome biogenesis GTPase Der [Planctomycetia bacterium]|nr:ribosome biogenesis GTPase Der [Planctomycetia bacterium]